MPIPLSLLSDGGHRDQAPQSSLCHSFLTAVSKGINAGSQGFNSEDTVQLVIEVGKGGEDVEGGEGGESHSASC